MLKTTIIIGGIILVLLTLVFVISNVVTSTYGAHLYCKEQGYENYEYFQDEEEYYCYKYVKLENQTGYEKEYSGVIKYGDFR